MAPSDPDFPFELDALKILLTIDKDYPTSSPTIRIKNTEIPRELISKVENGWKTYAQANRNMILLDLFKWLDKNLEQLLISKEEKQVESSINNSIRFYKPEEIKVSSKIQEHSLETQDETQEIDSQQSEMIQSLNIQDQPVNKSSNNLPINTHKGTQLRVPKVQLVNIGLLKCISLAISLNCPRCKGTIDTRLSPNPKDSADGVGEVWLTCPVCSLSVGIFMQF
jgi:hypothetical protein